ncbi:Iron-sulfur cluster assembly accessory protein [Aphelenchoides avenae]|nr:Iron-sulfur cluster assembly accessory protein [Aphelenchus avenae]
MAAAELRKEGWYVDADKLPDALGDDYSEAISAANLRAHLLNCDIREFGDTALAERWDKQRSELTGPVVLQLSKWRNASESKYAEHVDDDGVCVLDLTDGHLTVRGMQSDPQPLHNINGNTPYGSKILLTGKILLENNYLLLDNRNCKFLGGHVDKLVDRWNAERFGNSKNARKATGAPKWIPFGKARDKGGEQPSADTRSFKAMEAAAPAQTTEATEPSERSEEFEAARKANIEMAAQERAAGKKFAQTQQGVKKFKAPREEPDGDRADARQQNPRQPRNDGQRRSPQGFGEDKTKYRNGRGGGRRGRGDAEEFTAPRPPHGSTLFDYVQSQVQLPDISPPAPPEYRPYSENERSNYDANRSNRGRPGWKPATENGGARPSHGRYNFQDSPRGQQYGGGGNGFGRRGDYSASSSERPFSMPQNTGFQPTNKRYNGGRRGQTDADGGRRGHSDVVDAFDRMSLQSRSYQEHDYEDNHGHAGRYYHGNEQRPPRFVRTFTRTQYQNEPEADVGRAARDGVTRGQWKRPKRYSNDSSGLGSSESSFHRSGKNSQTNIDDYWQSPYYLDNICELQATFDAHSYIEDELLWDTLSVDTALEPDEKAQAVWTKGSLCLAPWIDGNFYPAVIQQFGPVDLCTVFYTEYHNYSVVPVRKLARLDRNS